MPLFSCCCIQAADNAIEWHPSLVRLTDMNIVNFFSTKTYERVLFQLEYLESIPCIQPKTRRIRLFELLFPTGEFMARVSVIKYLSTKNKMIMLGSCNNGGKCRVELESAIPGRGQGVLHLRGKVYFGDMRIEIPFYLQLPESNTR